MGYIVEITEEKMESLSDHIEKGLRHLGKAMQCVDEWSNSASESEDRGRGYRHGYGERDDDWEDMDDRDDRGRGYGRGYGERRGYRRRDIRGRYM